MEFNEFTERIADSIAEYLLHIDIAQIRIEKVIKNNGIVCTGLVICENGESVSPNIYLDYYYVMYKQNNDFEDVCMKISQEYIEAKKKIINNIDVNLEFDKLKDKIFIKLVNYERNKNILKDCPHIKYLDLAVTFRYLVRKDENGIASAMVGNKEMLMWNIDTDTIYDMAKNNTKKLFPCVVMRLNEMLDESELCGSCNTEDINVFVVTNSQGVNGATYMIYEDIISSFADKIQDDLYILPSSIHEVLLVPAGDYDDRESLAEMVSEINKFVVSEFDYLSDNVYFYDRNSGRICI